MITKIDELYGRQISADLIEPQLLQNQRLTKRTAITIKSNHICCSRCGQLTKKSIAKLPRNNFYCPKCINLGRVSTLHNLCSIPEPNCFPNNDTPLTWNGQLTNSQQNCARRIVKGFANHQRHLLWAVTGAGKTEMLFLGIDWAIKRGLRIGIASPRVDVCIELFPRIQAAFKTTSLVLLHGKTELPYQYAQITICTTHQLLRFYQAFDCLIIDEVDSFPYAQDKGLHYAVQQALKKSGSLLYLTATPSLDLLKQINTKQLLVSYLPLRFHRHLLPTIKLNCDLNWEKKLKKGRLSRILLRLIQDKLKRNIRFLLFVPKIEYLFMLDTALQNKIVARWDTVYSADPNRLSKVQKMRSEKIDFLITTTILERGVTFSGIDVIVLGADDAIFSSSALVQIAGRVGRKEDRPTGDVNFIASFNNKRIQSAKKQIQKMNRLGAKILNES